MLRIGLQAKAVKAEKLPPSNLVFLIDVSGSMSSEDKLPLLVRSLNVLLDGMRDEDVVSIVTYSGDSNVAMPPTHCTTEGKKKVREQLASLRAYGYTAGCKGIQKAYDYAESNFLKNGNNRVILATDGDFNVGQTSDAELKDMIVKRRDKGIFLTVLGFGRGNLNDSMMETIADCGNGNYAYIDSYSEAKKFLGAELMGTLYTVAKDVKILADFNPLKIKLLKFKRLKILYN